MIKGLYIHIPFCEQICLYCDFHKELATVSKQQDYYKALFHEIEALSFDLSSVDTIYLGGGTPSKIAKEVLNTLFELILQKVNQLNIREWTIEVNPEHLTKDFVEFLLNSPINRVSIGVQTFHPKILSFLRRTHTVDAAINGIQLLKEANFPNISVDLMFALPFQSEEDLKKDLKAIIDLDVHHISYYSLIIEEQSILYHKLSDIHEGIIDEDTEGNMYNTVIDSLKEAGYTHYEISNFAKKGYASKHNLHYWQFDDYLGLGSSSHSKVNHQRFFHLPNVTKYIKDPISYKMEEIDELSEEVIMGLRLSKGINIDKLNQKYQIDFLQQYPAIENFITDGYLEFRSSYLSFTRKGLMIGNMILQEFIGGER